jgi:hypothetical protein
MALALVGLLVVHAGFDDLHVLVNQPTYTHDLTIPNFKQNL